MGNDDLLQKLQEVDAHAEAVMLEDVDKDKLKNERRIPVDFMHLSRELIPTDFMLNVVALVGSIATMMSAATTFTSGVSSTQIELYGKQKFEIVSSILTFFPMVYTLMLILLLHNKKSSDTFYDLLRYGVLLDFPATADIGYIVTNWRPLLFIVVSLFYFLFSASVFLQFLAPVNVWIIFYKQFFLEVVLFWYENQTVEDNFISVSEFFESFDDRSDDPVIDRYTLTRCARVVVDMKAVASDASYKSYAGTHGFRRTTKKSKTAMNFFIFFLIATLCGLAYLSFLHESLTAAQDDWESKVTPCMQVCFDRSGRNPFFCYECMCDCITAFGVELEYGACAAWLSVPGCDSADICKPSPTHNCQGS